MTVGKLNEVLASSKEFVNDANALLFKVKINDLNNFQNKISKMKLLPIEHAIYKWS